MLTKIAHRGAMGYEPENTLLSFKKAMDLKADMVEMDVYKCKTGELVIIHDYTVNRTTNGSGYIWDLTFEELRNLDAGKGQRIPRLEEVLDSLKDIKVDLELKGQDTARPVYELIVNYVKQGKWRYDDFYVSSFNHPLLKDFLAFFPGNPGIKICPLILGIPIGLARFAEELNAYSINISIEFINYDIVNDAHNRGMKVFVFVVNDLNDLHRMQSLGVDGIFTNYLDML